MDDLRRIATILGEHGDSGPQRYARGQLVQPGPGRQGYAKKTKEDIEIKKKDWRKAINKGKAATLAKALELKGIKICSDKGTKCGTKLAADDSNLFMKLAQKNKAAMKLFASGKIKPFLMQAKNWAGKNMGPTGWIGGELLVIGLGGAYEMSQGKGWKEALDTWAGLGGHFGIAEKRLKEIGKEQGWSEKQVSDALKYGKLLKLDVKAYQTEGELKEALARQEIGGTARYKSSRIPSVTQNITGALHDEEPSYPDYSGTRHMGEKRYVRGKYQDPKFLRNLKEEAAGVWDEGDALWKTLMNPETSSALYQELRDRKKYEELEKKNKIWEWSQRGMVDQRPTRELDPFERSPGHPGYTGAFKSFDPWEEYAGGGIAAVRRPDAIPPRSGPMPDGGGLSTMFNRVRTW